MHGACRCALTAFAEAIADMALAASAAFLSIRLDLCPRPRAHPAGFQPGTSGLSVALAPADERTLHLSHRSIPMNPTEMSRHWTQTNGRTTGPSAAAPV